MNYGLLFDVLLDNAKYLFGYVDTDYGQDLNKRRSTTGCKSKSPSVNTCLHLAVEVLVADLPCRTA